MKQKLLIFGIFFFFLSAYSQQGIIGGNNTTIQDNPWQVSIRATNNYHIVNVRNQHICGGSIIAPNWILTAAHCITNLNGGLININEITIASGITQRTDNVNGQYRNVVEIIRHPNYNPINLENDVALIRINTNLNYNTNVGPILLTNSSSNSSVGTVGRVTGWGDTTSGGIYTPSAQLQTLNLPIISISQANNLNTGNISVTNFMIPLFQTGAGVAPGDSGGPLTVVKNGIRYLIGCSSWGEFPKDNKPTIYTDLYDFRTWISNIVPLPDIIGNSPICFSPNKTFNLVNANTSSVTWQVSSNLQIINSSNTNITVRALSSTTNGNGFIEALFNGVTLRKDVTVGTQNLGIDNYMILDETPELTVEKKNANGYDIEWRINGVLVTSNQGGTTWMRFNLNDYNYLCTNGKLTLAMRENGPCGWSNYVYRQYNCTSGEYLYRYSPNPATEILTISRNNQSSNTASLEQNSETENSHKYMIYDFNGNLILKGDLLNVENVIDVSALTKGTYILNIQIDSKIEEKHLIIIN